MLGRDQDIPTRLFFSQIYWWTLRDPLDLQDLDDMLQPDEDRLCSLMPLWILLKCDGDPAIKVGLLKAPLPCDYSGDAYTRCVEQAVVNGGKTNYLGLAALWADIVLERLHTVWWWDQLGGTGCWWWYNICCCCCLFNLWTIYYCCSLLVCELFAVAAASSSKSIIAAASDSFIISKEKNENC